MHHLVWPSADAAQRPTQRDDDRRRAFLQPRRWLEPCETPYFATRGRGDMRGVPNRSCTQSHPGGGAGLCYRRGAVCIILCTTWLCGAMTACHHLRGGIFGTPSCGPRMSPTPRSAKYGATHSGNPSRGGGNARLWSSSPLLAEWADASLRPVLRCFGCALGVLGGLWAQKNRCLSIDSK